MIYTLLTLLVCVQGLKDVAPLGKKDQEKQVAELRSHYQKKIKELERELKEAQEQLSSAR